MDPALESWCLVVAGADSASCFTVRAIFVLGHGLPDCILMPLLPSELVCAAALLWAARTVPLGRVKT
jgi:hypothetical protein